MSAHPSEPPTTPAEEEPLDQLWVSSWSDPPGGDDGFDPRSAYVEQFWLGLMGPSTIWFIRHCRSALDDAPDGFVLDLAETAAVLGLGHRGGRNSPMVRTIARACRFQAARAPGAGRLEIRRLLPPLHRAQVSRLPEVLQMRHAVYVGRPHAGDRLARRRRARRLALGLVECGDGIDLAEHQLGQWEIEPDEAADAVRWAWEVHHGEANAPVGADG